MLKSIFSPVQAWLISQGKCVGCGMPLDKANHQPDGQPENEKVTCKCGRIFIYDKTAQKYRRALMSEA